MYVKHEMRRCDMRAISPWRPIETRMAVPAYLRADLPRTSPLSLYLWILTIHPRIPVHPPIHLVFNAPPRIEVFSESSIRKDPPSSVSVTRQQLFLGPLRRQANRQQDDEFNDSDLLFDDDHGNILQQRAGGFTYPMQSWLPRCTPS